MPSTKPSIPASSNPYGKKPADFAPGELQKLEAAAPRVEKVTPEELDRVARELRRARAEDALRALKKRQANPPSPPTTIQ